MYLVKILDVLNLHPTLAEIVLELDAIAGPGLITSAYRPGDSGVHGQMPVRGIDRRCRNAAIGNAMKEWINRKWEYDPERPHLECCIFHKCEQYGWHLHIQAHENTRRR